MQNRKRLPLALVLLLLGTCLALPALAAERVDPGPTTAASSCSASAATSSLPSFLVSPQVLRDTDPTQTCGCGDNSCVGQAPGSRCISLEMGIHVCRVVTGLCPTTGSKCVCFLAP
jgi:hypothetical protein